MIVAVCYRLHDMSIEKGKERSKKQDQNSYELRMTNYEMMKRKIQKSKCKCAGKNLKKF
jgi:hypothetical protein